MVKKFQETPVLNNPKPSGKGFLGKRAFMAVVYGPSGVGKTSFAAEFPNVGFIIDPKEQGIHELNDFKRCPTPKKIWEPSDYDELLKICDQIALKNEYGIQTLCLDSATGFELMCFQSHCDEHFNGDWGKDGFLSFQQGPKAAAKTDWPKLLDALSIITQKGINVIFIAHSQVRLFANPEGKDYDRYTAYLDKETWQQMHRWASMVLFMNFYQPLEQEGSQRKAKASGDTETFLFTSPNTCYDAKNRFGLTGSIKLGNSSKESFEAFKKAYQSAINKSNN